MNKLPSPVLPALVAAVGPDWVISDPDHLLVYEADAQTASTWPPRRWSSLPTPGRLPRWPVSSTATGYPWFPGAQAPDSREEPWP